MERGVANACMSGFGALGSSPTRFFGLLVAKRQGRDYRGRGFGPPSQPRSSGGRPTLYFLLHQPSSGSPRSIPSLSDVADPSSAGSPNFPSEGVTSITAGGVTSWDQAWKPVFSVLTV